MDVGTMTDQVLRDAGLTDTDPLVTRQVVLDALNEAQSIIAAMHDWPWLQAVTTFDSVAGQAAYLPPANWDATRRILDQNGIPLERADAGQLAQDFGLLPGTPFNYAINDDKIVLAPIPDAIITYTHEYLLGVTELTVDSSVSVIPAEFHRTLVAYATAKALEITGRLDRAPIAANRFSQMVKGMERAMRRDRGPMRVRIRPDEFI